MAPLSRNNVEFVARFIQVFFVGIEDSGLLMSHRLLLLKALMLDHHSRLVVLEVIMVVGLE